MKLCTAEGDKLNEPGSMSQNAGRAPVRAIVPAVAKKVNGDVITSSPAPMPSAMRASSSASVPEDTPTACAAPQYSAISVSNARTFSPRMKCWLSHTLSMAASTAARSGAYCALRSSNGTFVMVG